MNVSSATRTAAFAAGVQREHTKRTAAALLSQATPSYRQNTMEKSLSLQRPSVNSRALRQVPEFLAVVGKGELDV